MTSPYLNRPLRTQEAARIDFYNKRRALFSLATDSQRRALITEWMKEIAVEFKAPNNNGGDDNGRSLPAA